MTERSSRTSAGLGSYSRTSVDDYGLILRHITPHGSIRFSAINICISSDGDRCAPGRIIRIIPLTCSDGYTRRIRIHRCVSATGTFQIFWIVSAFAFNTVVAVLAGNIENIDPCSVVHISAVFAYCPGYGRKAGGTYTAGVS